MIRLLRGPGDAERMMAAQLLGTGGIAALLLGATIVNPSIADAALTLALLAAFASVAFVPSGGGSGRGLQLHARCGRMSAFARLSTIVAVTAGVFFFLAGTVGLLRFPIRSPACTR